MPTVAARAAEAEPTARIQNRAMTIVRAPGQVVVAEEVEAMMTNKTKVDQDRVAVVARSHERNPGKTHRAAPAVIRKQKAETQADVLEEVAAIANAMIKIEMTRNVVIASVMTGIVLQELKK